MVYFWIARTDTGQVLAASVRKPLDNLSVAQWFNEQLFLSVPGDVVSVTPVAIYGTFNKDSDRGTATNYNSSPSGSIFYQIDTKVFYRWDGTNLTVYTWPAQTANIPVVAAVKAKRLIHGGIQTWNGSDGALWSAVWEGYTMANTSPPTQSSNTAPVASDYNTWASGQTAPIPPLNAFTYTNGPNQSSGSLTMVFRGFAANASVKLTVYLYRASYSPWAGQAVKVAINGTAVADWVYPSSAFATYTVTATADSAGVFSVVMGARSGVSSAEVRYSAAKAEEQ